MLHKAMIAAGALVLLATMPAMQANAQHATAQPAASSIPADSITPRWGGGEYRYGTAPRQAIDFYPARTTEPGDRPLIVFIHGGAWQYGDRRVSNQAGKAVHFPKLGYHFASVGYRLVPDVRIEDQAADIAASLRYLIDNAERFGIAADRIVLLGHSAGAHLAALVGTDPAYLEGVGLSTRSVAGIIALDGAAYDATVPDLDLGFLGALLYSGPFGNDPARQARLSPVHNAGGGSVADFLLLHVQRRDAISQARALENALRAGGSNVVRQGVEGRGLSGHNEINNRLGYLDYPATRIVDEWLAALFARWN